ncbi:ribonuclease P protein subunit p14-like [Bolinopsis microptera]|uniref:ribonuclease P protein subunit p14-like n=1 Tax=Bolinopsis microptera TaxID=2820187 RepID=UPI003079C64D
MIDLPKAVKLSFSKLPPNWSYLKVSVMTPVNLDITDIEFKSAIMQSLQVHHGKVGSLSHVDVLKITSMTKCHNGYYSCHVILRVARQQKQHVWSALTLIKSFQGSRCAMNVVKESPVLVSLLPSQTSPHIGHSRYRHQPAVF